MEIRDLRTQVDRWVSQRFAGGTFADGGGQRLVYRIPTKSAALKVWIATDAVQHERHVREVDALASIDHPNLPHVVAPVTRIDVEGQSLAFYLEQWLSAPSLRSQISDFPLAEDRFRPIALAAAEAVGMLHRANIVHRDMSLGNVLANHGSTYVIDLGLAKHLDLDGLTQSGVRLPRTEITASPEQLQGASGDLRSPTDIFSLGVVLSIVATGTHPYLERGEQVELGTLIHRQLSQDIRRLPVGNIGQLIEDMLNPVTMYRPNAGAVFEALS